jgi:PAS domain S-box-containing protein
VTDATIEKLKRIDKRLSQPAVDLGMALFEAFPDALIITDEECKIAFINTRALLIFGYANGELIGEPVEILIMDEDRARHIELRDQYRENPHPIAIEERGILRARFKDGTPLHVAVGVFPVTIKDVPYFVATVRKADDEPSR